MRTLRWSTAAAALALALPATSESQTPDYADYDEYAPAVAEYYGEPVDRIPRWIDPDELPIIYLLAREAGVSPGVVIALRERGWSWIDITYHLGVDPYIYVDRMPYTTGYWRRYSAWELRYLTDRHIIDYVNLLFWADYHRRPVTQIIVIRQRVPSWRHYVRYHSPPRSYARGVYIRRPPSRPGYRYDTGRTAVPRDESQRRDARDRDRRDARERDRRDDRYAQPPGTPGTRPAQGIRRDPPASDGRARRAEERSAQPRGGQARPSSDERERSRPTATPSRRDATPSRGEATPSRGSAVRRNDGGSSRSDAAPSTRSSSPSSRGSAAPSTRGGSSSSRGTAAPRSSQGSGRRGN